MKSKPLRKLRKTPLAKLKRDLWKLISEYVRRKHSDKNGMVKCFTCGRRYHWKKMDAGHGIPKSRGQIARYCEDNIRPQCTSCNIFKNGEGFTFAANLDKEMGAGFSAQILEKTREVKKHTREEIEQMIEEYKKKIVLLSVLRT